MVILGHFQLSGSAKADDQGCAFCRDLKIAAKFSFPGSSKADDQCCSFSGI
jgi:hypothetical protein